MKKAIRRLGLGETWLALLHDEAGGTAQTVLIAEILGKMTQTTFLGSIQYLLKCYPQLTYQLKLKDDGYYLVEKADQASAIDIQYLTMNDESEWKKISQDEANTVLDAKNHLFRIKCLTTNKVGNKFFIIFTIHHSISDGLSLIAILDALLAYYKEPKLSVNVYPNPGAMGELYTSPRITDPTLAAKLEKLNDIKTYQWPHQVKSELKNRVTHYIFGQLNSTELQTLAKAAKEHNLTINGVLNAAMLLSAQKLLKKTFNGELSTPVNLRMKTDNKAHAYDVGFLVEVINTVHANVSDNTSLIDLAKEYNDQIKERLSCLQFSSTYDFHLLKNSLQEVWNPARDYFCYPFMVTNLGLIKLENESNDFKVQSLRFITCRRAADNNLMLYVNSIQSGCFYTFGYPFPAITHEWATSFVTFFNDFLKKFMKA